MNATILKGNMVYDQYTVPNLRSGVIYFVFAFLVLWLEREKNSYTVPDTVAVEPTFVAFL